MNKLKVIILCGPPGSGKSTWGKNVVETNPNIVRLCPDEFRKQFGGSEENQAVSARAFDATRRGMDEALENGKDVLIDATCMYRKARKQFLDIAKKHEAYTVAVVFEVSKDILLQRNKERGDKGGRNVPEWVIDNMLSKYEVPSKNEGFDEIKFIN
jgi:predicted kinase